MNVNKKFLIVILGIYLFTFIAILQNIRTPYLWFDEAGQFFLSKGLNHNSLPLAKPGGLSQVIENNRFFNLDPGGFTVLLHFWSYVSNYHIWLRILPFLFFIGVVLSFIYLGYIWLKNINIALLLGFIPILTPVILAMGFEIRAYSMETLGTILCVIALEKLRTSITNKQLFLWSCIFSFFITSRYSEIVIVFLTSLYILYLIFQSNGSLKQKLTSSIIYAIPLVPTLICIWGLTLRFQNKHLKPLVYLEYLGKDFQVLFQINNFLFFCAVIGLTILFFLRKRYQWIKKYEALLFLTVSTNLAFIGLSFLNIYPWLPFCNRSISILLLVLLCLTAFIGEIILPLFKNPEILKYYFLGYVIISTLYIRKDALLIRYSDDDTYTDLGKINVADYKNIYVVWTEAPSIKYLYEYGKFKTKKTNDGYPSHFTFGLSALNENIIIPTQEVDSSKYDLIISSHSKIDKWR